MNKAEAFHDFWSSFGVTAWDANTVPDEETMRDAGIDPFPRLTYTFSVGYWEDGNILQSANLFYRSTSWDAITAKADEIAARIGLGGIYIPYDGGGVWLKRGTPFYQRMADPEDDMIRRIYFNLAAEFLSAD